MELITTIDKLSRHLARQPKLYFKERKTKYIRCSCGFDIETTRVQDRAYMYHWQMSLGDAVIIGRKWDQYFAVLTRIRKWLKWQQAVLIVWVANLGHEFQFLAARETWQRIFAIDDRQPLRATADRIEYRECLSISGQGGLAELAKNYTTTKKMVGDLDYEIPRNSMTPLTNEELRYCLNDVIILKEWMDYCLKQYTDRGLEIPLTMTGIPRFAVRKAAEETGEIDKIRAAVSDLFPDRDTYNLVMRYLFRGGYTHASAWWTYITEDHVIGADFTSSYPASMLHFLYPSSPFVRTELQHTEDDITDPRMGDMAVWMWIRIKGIKRRTVHSVESESKIIHYSKAHFDNGRLREAEEIDVLLTDVDWDIYKMVYKWDAIEIRRAYIAYKAPLPQYLLKVLMAAYIDKLHLAKAGKKDSYDYINAKIILNSTYGMCVTRLNLEEWYYDRDSWTEDDPRVWRAKPSRKTYRQLISKQILSPWWGIYVTAYSRRSLVRCITMLDRAPEDANVLYCDTDSIYCCDTPRNREIIEAYNNEVRMERNAQLPEEFCDIGCFDWIDPKDAIESPTVYTFKTLGAKRYCKWYKGKDGWHSEVTVSGMRKGTLEAKITTAFCDSDESYPLMDPITEKRIGFVTKDRLFDAFCDGMLLSCSETQRSRAAYHDHEPTSDVVTDLHGNTETMTELTSVAIVPVQYQLKMAEEYLYLVYDLIKQRRRPIWR